jgi:hypothetical protein
MISLRKDSNGTQSGDSDEAREGLPQSKDGSEPVQSSEPWVYPTSPRTEAAEVFRPSPIAPQKKRGHHHADYRELLALEWEAPRLNLCRPNTGARLNLEDSPVDERAVRSGENNGSEEIPVALSNSDNTAFLDANRPVILVVDQRMNMHFGSGRDLKSVIAVKTAAMIAWRMLASRKPMGTIVFNDKRMLQLGVGCNRLHTLLTLQALVNQNHDLSPDAANCSNPRMLNDAMRSVRKLAADPLIFLVTDASGSDEETFRLATNISQSNNLVIVLIYDPSQTKYLGSTRGRRFERCFFPEGVPVVIINTRSDLLRQLRRSLTTPALRAFVAARAQRTIQSSTASMP